jgi:hypothetical protein
MPQDRFGMPIQHAACFGEQDAFRAARHQLSVQLGFQAGKMMADRRLRHMQLIRSAREAASLNDPDEITKLAQVH